MILVITCKEDATADYFCKLLADDCYLRVDTDDIEFESLHLSMSKHSVSLNYRGVEILPSQVSGIWYRKPKPMRFSSTMDDAEEAHYLREWRGALEGFLAHIPFSKWINHPSRNMEASYKPEQLSRAFDYGLNIPDYVISTNKDELLRFCQAYDRCIIKPVRDGLIRRDEKSTLIYTNNIDPVTIQSAEIYSCPTLIQERVLKDKDVRITWLDGKYKALSLTRTEDAEQILDIRKDNMAKVSYELINLPDEVVEKLKRIISHYELRFAAIDMAIDIHGKWYFFEVNPNGQWAWMEIEGHMSFSDMLIHSLS